MRPSYLDLTRCGTARRAFTLIELLIVLTIMSVVMALAMPRVDIGRYRADGLAQVVRKSLQHAQRTSLVRQHDVLVSFDTTRQRIRVALDANNDGLIGSAEVITWQSLSDGGRFTNPPKTVDGGVAPSIPIAAASLKSFTSMPSVTFHRDGSVSSDLGVYFTTKSGAVTDFRAVTVLQSTGRVEWYRYGKTATWKLGAI